MENLPPLMDFVCGLKNVLARPSAIKPFPTLLITLDATWGKVREGSMQICHTTRSTPAEKPVTGLLRNKIGNGRSRLPGF
jgi:hypothetical protein